MKTDRISENEISDILGDGLPEINRELEKIAGAHHIGKTMLCFARYTLKCMETGNLNMLNACFNIAETLLSKGNQAVKTAVENVYVFSVSSVLEMASPWQTQIKYIIPTTLKNTFQKVKLSHQS